MSICRLATVVFASPQWGKRSERQPMRSGLRNIIIIQLIVTAAVALGALAWRGEASALAAVYGGGIVLLNSFLLARRVRRAGELEGSSVAATMYAGAAQRFVIAAAAFGLGMGVLRLEPVPMIAAFAAAQFALVFAAQQQSP